MTEFGDGPDDLRDVDGAVGDEGGVDDESAVGDDAGAAASGAAVHTSAWAATIDDMLAMAEEMEENGWDTVTITAGDTGAESPDAGDTDRFGLTYVVPDNKAEAFEEAFEGREFPRYEVYRAEREGRSFVLTVLLDPETATAILLAGNYELRTAGGCIRAAIEADAMYTHVQLLDGTHLGSFRHEDYEKFFPESDIADYTELVDRSERDE